MAAIGISTSITNSTATASVEPSSSNGINNDSNSISTMVDDGGIVRNINDSRVWLWEQLLALLECPV
jgi:hypothetical protein